MVVYTLGHSTMSLAAFVSLLRTRGIARVVDIRTIPRSRHNPQFNRETLAPHLRNRRIGYRHLPGLGGLRRPRADSPNGGWRNPSFRGFADYMQTPEFQRALSLLITVAAAAPVAIMCAEAVPWRCHRSLVADALLIRGLDVMHLIPPQGCRPHTLTPMATLRGLTLVYPPPDQMPSNSGVER